MTRAEVYNDIARLEQLMDEYYQVQTLDPSKLPVIARPDLGADCAGGDYTTIYMGQAAPDDLDHFVALDVEGYLCELKDAQIRDGLHTLGQAGGRGAAAGLLLTTCSGWTTVRYAACAARWPPVGFGLSGNPGARRALQWSPFVSVSRCPRTRIVMCLIVNRVRLGRWSRA